MLAVGTFGCAATYEHALRDDLREIGGTLELGRSDARSGPPDGTLTSYVELAMRRSPDLLASYERWRAATLRIAPARQLPDPTITYGYYAMPVQTRVGPQRHRLMLRQAFPWPTKLTASADAQSMRARSAQRRFEAQALAVRRRVAEAWWRLWAVRRARGVESEQLEILGGLAEAMRARIEVGQASLADISQVELTRARIADALAGLDEQERSAEAALRAAIAADGGVPLPTVDEVSESALPVEDGATLRAATRENPLLETFAREARASEAQAGALEADRFPSFAFGLDWIETGPAATAVPGSGDDALIVNVGISVPLWQEAYDDAQRAAEADARAHRAEGRAAEDAALAELEQALSSVRDSHRRIALYERTLLPQASAAYESVVAGTVVGRSSLASVLIAERDLLEISLSAIRARAEHGASWAQLERVVGRPVEPARADSAPSDSAPSDSAPSDPVPSDPATTEIPETEASDE